MRLALLGSPGVGIQRRVSRGMIGGTPARLIGGAATYAAVVAGHHLDVQVYVPGAGLVTEVIPFTGAEASQAAFIATINSLAKKFTAKPNATTPADLELDVRLLGSLAQATLLASTSADVLASLGLPAGPAAFDPSFGVRMLHKRNWGRADVMYTGGRLPVFGTPEPTPHSALQHGVAIRWGRSRGVLVVDRQTVRTVASDSVHFTPERTPGAE